MSRSKLLGSLAESVQMLHHQLATTMRTCASCRWDFCGISRPTALANRLPGQKAGAKNWRREQFKGSLGHALGVHGRCRHPGPNTENRLNKLEGSCDLSTIGCGMAIARSSAPAILFSHSLSSCAELADCERPMIQRLSKKQEDAMAIGPHVSHPALKR